MGPSGAGVCRLVSAARRGGRCICARPEKPQVRNIRISHAQRTRTETKNDSAMRLEYLVRDIDFLELTDIYYSLELPNVDFPHCGTMVSNLDSTSQFFELAGLIVVRA